MPRLIFPRTLCPAAHDHWHCTCVLIGDLLFFFWRSGWLVKPAICRSLPCRWGSILRALWHGALCAWSSLCGRQAARDGSRSRGILRLGDRHLQHVHQRAVQVGLRAGERLGAAGGAPGRVAWIAGCDCAGADQLLSFVGDLARTFVGLVSLAIILTSLVGRVPMPLKLPGTVGAFIVAGSMYGLMVLMDYGPHAEASTFNPADGLLPYEWTDALKCGWFSRMQDTLNYLPLIIPFALATVVGGIDCTESAIAAGDHYDTRTVIGVEAFATLVASFCGAVIQTTPYIGHPAYKAMGGRAAYTLITALFMGFMGIVGLFGYFYQFIPAVAVFPILVFVGVEITAQSFLATPRRHYTAVAIACVPALAALAMNFMDQIWFPVLEEGKHPAFAANTELVSKVEAARLLSHGFILTSIFWASALAMAIDRKLVQSAYYYLAAAVLYFVRADALTAAQFADSFADIDTRCS